MRRLRWQLTLSHLIAIACTLLSMVAALVLIASAWFGSQSSPERRPAEMARTVAQAVGGMVGSASTEELNTMLRALTSGQLRLGFENGPPQGAMPGTRLTDAMYVALVDGSGALLASSAPEGARFAPSEAGEWQSLATRAMRDQHSLAVAQPAASSGANAPPMGAAPVVDDRGRPIAAVIVALPSAAGVVDPRPGLWPLAVFGVASIAVLAGASVFALLASTLVGYLLSRRLVGRLEALSQAAEALRQGGLSSRVAVSGADEVADLQRAFNSMATDLERAMGALHDERDRVTGLLESRRQLVAGVSHELRTPIATVRGYLESLLNRDGALSSEMRADLETADREVVRLEGMVDDLFTLARAELGRLELRLAPTDVGALVRAQVETQAPLAWRQRQVQLIADVPSEGPLGQLDPQRVAQIVSNLISNAVRHTPPGGIVAARVMAEPQWVCIEVRDTGEGIPADVLPRVFERFYQGAEGRERGAGLGLALVKELAESMGGHVAAESAPGEGSCFSVRLPATG